MTCAFTIKQGDTLALNGQLMQDDGTPIDITAVVITSQIRDGKNNLVGAAVVTMPQPTNGQFVLTWQSDSTWPLGTLRLDVKYVSGTQIVHSDTMTGVVAAAVTA